MFRIFGDIPHCLDQRDDILLGARDDTEHHEDCTSTSHIQQREMPFHETSPDKLKAIQECRAPEDKEAVCSFLGMAEYRDNFIENYAT